jgi:cation transport regulator ChaB
MKTTLTNKTHGKFWALLKLQPRYDDRFREYIKEGVVYYYSGGRTTSLSEMYAKYPREYADMLIIMQRGLGKNIRREIEDKRTDVLRKRVIAAICQWLDKTGRRFDDRAEKIRYAKQIACRSTNCAEFNQICDTELNSIYCQFNRKNATGIAPEVAMNVSMN